MQCPNCGFELPGKPCNQCGKKNPDNHKFCGFCGSKIIVRPAAVENTGGAAPKTRIACSDGMCVGIIGEGNKCVLCGKPYSGAAL